MTLDDLLARLEGVRRSGRGWMARCAAHSDRSPSLSIMEGEDGRIVLHCFAGCTIEEICSALRITVTDLFADSISRPSLRRCRHAPQYKAQDWRAFAESLQLEADALWLRGTRVREAAKGLDISTWSEEELEVAWEAVTSAQTDLVLAECYRNLALNLRAGGLKKDDESRRAKT